MALVDGLKFDTVGQQYLDRGLDFLHTKMAESKGVHSLHGNLILDKEH
jgi:hypothetical protein